MNDPNTTRKTSTGQPSGADRAGDVGEMVVDMVREISLQTDPQDMITIFRKHTRWLYGSDSSLSLSRRDLSRPHFRVTRSTHWQEQVNPWTEQHRLPLLAGGILADLLYGNELKVLRDLDVGVSYEPRP